MLNWHSNFYATTKLKTDLESQDIYLINSYTFNIGMYFVHFYSTVQIWVTFFLGHPVYDNEHIRKHIGHGK